MSEKATDYIFENFFFIIYCFISVGFADSSANRSIFVCIDMWEFEIAALYKYRTYYYEGIPGGRESYNHLNPYNCNRGGVLLVFIKKECCVSI